MDNPFDCREGLPVILGGKAWRVPLLAARQNKIIDPLILSLLPLFSEWQGNGLAALGKLGASQYDALIEISFQGIHKSHPELSRDDFLELPVTLPELVTAFSIIAQQTGIFQKGEKQVLGEALAGDSQ